MKKDWRIRFWKYVTFEPNTGCWLWCGPSNSDGYGVIGVGSRNMRAHRLSFEIHNERTPVGVVMHACDTPCCVNPQHLSAGSPRDNVFDMIAKGRHGAFAKALISGKAASI